MASQILFKDRFVYLLPFPSLDARLFTCPRAYFPILPKSSLTRFFPWKIQADKLVQLPQPSPGQFTGKLLDSCSALSLSHQCRLVKSPGWVEKSLVSVAPRDSYPGPFDVAALCLDGTPPILMTIYGLGGPASS